MSNSLVGVGVILVGLSAAAAPAEPTLVAAVSEMYATVSADFVAAAKLMPAASYDYRPTPDVRAFGQIVGHVAGSQFLYCMQGGGAKFDRTLIARLDPIRRYADPATPSSEPAPAKDVVVALLEDGVRYCEAVLTGLTDASALAPITLGARQVSRVRPLLDNIAHTNEHYGNIVTYLRERGLVPPSTSRASGRSGRAPASR